MNPNSAWVRGSLVAAAVFVLHESILRGLRIDGVRPDLPLGFALVAAVIAGPSVGAFLGFTMGLLEDLFVNTPFGLTALVASVVCFAVGAVYQSVGASHGRSVPVLAAAGSVAALTSWAALGTVLGLPSLLRLHLLVVAAVIATVNALASLPFAIAVRWMFAGEGHPSYGH